MRKIKIQIPLITTGITFFENVNTIPFFLLLYQLDSCFRQESCSFSEKWKTPDQCSITKAREPEAL